MLVLVSDTVRCWRWVGTGPSGGAVGKLKKVVRFYEPKLFTSGKADPETIKNGFWTTLLQIAEGLPEKERLSTFRAVAYVGEAHRPRDPATPYVYIGRFRPTADHPHNWRPGVGVTGTVRPEQKNDRIAEPTYVVPFGARNYVAIMHPSGAPTRTSAIDEWLNVVLKTMGTPERVQLVPVVDLRLDSKLDNAVGATTIVISALPGSDIPATGGGDIGDDFRRTAANAPTNATVEVKVSFGNRNASENSTNILLAAVKWVRQGDWAKKGKATLQLPAKKGVKTEKHDLIEDRIAIDAVFEIPDGAAPSERDLLRAMNKAIEDFGSRMAGQVD